MSAHPEEKVGVIVIHGVGETHEGWIDSYLVPQLETWAAFNGVTVTDPTTGKPKPIERERDKELIVVARALDDDDEFKDREVAISLGNDEHFKAFCKVLGLDSYADFANSENFKTYALRLKNLDKLKSFIVGPISVRKAGDLVAELRDAGVPSTIAFNSESEVYHVRDPDSSGSTDTWQSFTRRLPLDGRQVFVTELFWADLSKVGTTNVLRFSAILQLFLEAPYVLGAAFLKGCERGVHGFVSRLIHWSNWLMRWPIAGLTVVLLMTAFAAIVLQQLGMMRWLLPTVGISLATIAIVGFILFRHWVHRKLGLADLALSASVCALLLMPLLGYATSGASEAELANPRGYVAVAVLLLLVPWLLWTLLIVVAIVIVAGIHVKRWFIPAPGKPPVARSATALSLNLLLGLFWKFVLTVLGVLIIVTLAPQSESASRNCPSGMTISSIREGIEAPACMLGYVKGLLIDVSFVNGAAFLAVLIAAAIVVATRKAKVFVFGKKAREGTLALPRLITSPLIIVTLFAGALINAAAFLYFNFGELKVSALITDWVSRVQGESVASGLLGLVVFFFLFRRFLEASNSVVHIGRDLVDHQYDPSPNSFVMLLAPKDTEDDGTPKRFRRRRRIQRRLEALIEEVMVANQADRIVFLAHSQGTVIMHDYLVDHDNLVGAGHKANEKLFRDTPIDVITVGSPLTHIYRYYFLDYDHGRQLGEKNDSLIKRVRSWTNMWRVDDPIGQNVDLLSTIYNQGIGPGGHMDYWKEDAVCEKVWRLIFQAPDAASARSMTAAATAGEPVATLPDPSPARSVVPDTVPSEAPSPASASPSPIREPAPQPAALVTPTAHVPQIAAMAARVEAPAPRLDSDGHVDVGHLEPITPAVDLSQDLATKIRSAEERLSLDRLNSAPGWNPFLTGNDESKSFGPLVGAYTRAANLFESKTIVPVKAVFEGCVKSLPSPEAAAAMQPLLDALPPASLLRTPAHQFNVDGRIDTRVVLFGGDFPNHQADVDALALELGRRHMRVIVQWAHMAQHALDMSTQGGTPQHILGNNYMPAGSSHINAYSTGWLDGKPVVVTSNWGDASVLEDQWHMCGVHLLAIDYQAGARDPIPEETLAAYKHNADMWDCFSAVIVPFTGEDPFGLAEYTRNPLEVHDQATTRAVASELANLDWATFSTKYGAFYCAEAQYSIANFGPQEDDAGGTLLKKSRFGATPLGRVIQTFGEAPGYAEQPIEWCRQHPEIGWRWLLERGPENGGISFAGYEKLAIKLMPDFNAGESPTGFCMSTYSNRQGVFLEFVPEHIKGWQSYRPSNREALIASPLTAATTAWSLMRLYMPREGVARTLVEALLAAYASGSDAVKFAVTQLAGGQDPNGAAGRQALGALGMQLATGFMLQALTDDTGLESADREHYESIAQKRILSNAGYEQITNDADKAKVKEIWKSFLAVLGNPKNAAQDKMDSAMLELDRRAAEIVVERKAPKGQILHGLMRFVPPGSWAMWAQQPFYSEAYAVRYAATAIHKSLARSTD